MTCTEWELAPLVAVTVTMYDAGVDPGFPVLTWPPPLPPHPTIAMPVVRRRIAITANPNRFRDGMKRISRSPAKRIIARAPIHKSPKGCRGEPTGLIHKLEAAVVNMVTLPVPLVVAFVNTTLPGALMAQVGGSERFSGDTTLQLKFTVPVNPFKEETVMVELPDRPGDEIVTGLGLGGVLPREKSAAPPTVTVYVGDVDGI